MTVRVPTVPEAKQVCWEFATDGYDLGFGIYFDWTPVTNRAITVQISESSDDEDEDEEPEGQWAPSHPVSHGNIWISGLLSAKTLLNLGEVVKSQKPIINLQCIWRRIIVLVDAL